MMYRLLSSVAVAAVAIVAGSSANAADLPVKAPYQSFAPSFNWTGFYVGGHVGAGFGKADTSVDIGGLGLGLGIPGIAGNLPISQTNVSGFLGGLQAGYNWQVNQLFVVGLEGDFTWADINGTSPCLVTLSCSSKVNWMADFTGRAGVVAGNALIYLKGGVAWANTDYTLSFPGLFSSSTTDTRIGALLGTGVEYAVSRNWSAKLEYNYIDFGKDNESFAFPAPVAGAIPAQVDQQIHVVKAGLNYRW